MTRKLVLILIGAGLCVVAWWAGPQFSPAEVSPVDSASMPVITQLVGRDYVIRVESAPHGPVYTVLRSDGEVLVDRETLESLKAEYPVWYDRVTDSQAGLDASVRIDGDTFLPY